MLVITGIIKVESSEELARVKDALICHAQRSRGEAGNIDYTFTQSLEDPNEIRLIEKWVSEAALIAHLQTPDEEFNTLINTANLKSALVISHEVIDERILLEQ